MKRILLILFLITGFSAASKAQTADTIKVRRIADSVIVANSSNDFLDYLSKNQSKVSTSTRVSTNGNIDWKKLNDREHTKKFETTAYLVTYPMKLPNGDAFLLKTDTTTDVLSWGRPSVNIMLDTSYRLMNLPNVKILHDTYLRIKDAKLISRDSAIAESLPFFSLKKKRISNAVIEYDITSGLIYWRISKTKGKKNVQEEQVLINAETSEYLKKEIKEYVSVIAY